MRHDAARPSAAVATARPLTRSPKAGRRQALIAAGLCLCLAAGFGPSPARAVPFWGAHDSSPIDTPPAQLKPGEWIWGGDDRRLGPMAVVVSLTEQRAYVYRNGMLVAVSTVSSGKPGHETPTGVFTILQKDKDHHSNVYDNAPMPYQERLTWGGVALHAGGLPGYPESHGCIHLPSEFARRLFDSTDLGMTVVVAHEGSSPVSVVHPSAVSPVNPLTGAALDPLPLGEGQAFRWQPELAPTGPLSIVASTSTQQLIVYRDGIEIGRARVELAEPGAITGTHAFIVAASTPGALPTTAPTWISIGGPGHEADKGRMLTPADLAKLRVPADFERAATPLLTPGAVLVVTDAPLGPQTSGARLQVLDADPEPGATAPATGTDTGRRP